MKKIFLGILILILLLPQIVKAESSIATGCGTYHKNADGTCQDLSFETNSFSCTDEDGLCYKLQNLSKNFQIFNLNSDKEQTEVTDNDNSWYEQNQEQYVELSYNLESIYKYFYEKFGRKGYDNNYGLLKANIQESGDGANAGYYKDSQYAELNFFNGLDNIYGVMNILEITAHEFTHIFTNYEVNSSIGNVDAKTINEAFSDIFGVFINYYINGELDFLNSDEISNSHKVDRSLCDPESAGDPEHYSNYYNDPTNNAMSYVNTGFISIIFCHLIQGGTNNTSLITTSPIGLEKLEKILYYTMDNDFLDFLSSYDVQNYFLSFRDAIINSATYLSKQTGNNIVSNDIISIKTAFNSVGITYDSEFWLIPTIVYPGKVAVISPGATVEVNINLISKNNFSSNNIKLTPTISSNFPGKFTLRTISPISINSNETKQIIGDLTLNSDFSGTTTYYLDILAEDQNSSIKFNLHGLPILATSNPIALSATPKTAYIGEEIVINGYNLNKTSYVDFNAGDGERVSATITSKTFDVLKVLVPNSSVDGYIYVNNIAIGDGTAYLTFDVQRAPTTLEVGSDKQFSSISSALNVLEDGDTILVYDGTYEDVIWLMDKKNITVKSKNGPLKTIIDGSNQMSSLSVIDCDHIYIDGFTFKNVKSDFLKIFNIENSSFVISNNIFENSYVNQKNSYGQVFNIRIFDSYADSTFKNEVKDNLFRNNQSLSNNGEIIRVSIEVPEYKIYLNNNKIYNNLNNNNLIYLTGNVILFNNLIYKNNSGKNIIINDSYYGDPIIMNNVISDNSSSSTTTSYAGIGIYASTEAKLMNNIIYNNHNLYGVNFKNGFDSYKNYLNNIAYLNSKEDFYEINISRTKVYQRQYFYYF